MNHTTRKIAHLPAWVAFEAAARAGSFAAAAEELCVTPAAVSQHLRTLETYLGIRLFSRLAQGVVLTDEGRKVLPGVRDGLRSISSAVDLLAHRGLRDCVRVSASPAFASRWLLPRIHRFNRAYPGVDVKLEATPRLVDLDEENMDIAIRYGQEPPDGMPAERLFEEYVLPVASPALVDAAAPARLASDMLRRLPLIHDTNALDRSHLPSWSGWLRHHGIAGVDTTRGLFLDPSLAVQAAVEGRGVLLGRSVIVVDDLMAGRLVRAGAHAMKVTHGYFLVHADRSRTSTKVAAFRDWLMAEAALSQTACRELGLV